MVLLQHKVICTGLRYGEATLQTTNFFHVIRLAGAISQLQLHWKQFSVTVVDGIPNMAGN
jgi:hypothetical protein